MAENVEKKNILVVDDEKEIAELIEIHLMSQDYNVTKAKNGVEALKLLNENHFDLVLLDVMMPKMDGKETLKKIREKSNVPVIMVTAKTSEKDKVEGLTLGADDYVTKPIKPLELIARVKAQLRRFTVLNPNKVEVEEPNEIRIRNLYVNKMTHEVQVDEEQIKLTKIEFDILYLLAKNPNKVFSTEEIFENVWKEKNFDATNNVMVHIRRLRNKLKEETREEKIITTVWGVGYKIEK
ncbi:MAG: response regulator transcription factor [Lachnospiraceae bacterium]|nr:response regulator transcription factor [Lachnospiraceae bacterium]MBR1454714.1 response regulator transcription factor [Lachnospiraceae bacterium]